MYIMFIYVSMLDDSEQRNNDQDENNASSTCHSSGLRKLEKKDMTIIYDGSMIGDKK